MNDEMLDAAKQYIKQNLFVSILALIGIIFIIIGLFTLFNQDKNEIAFEEANSTEEESVSSKEIVIDIEGAVIKPGVYKLSKDSRIQDALILAGGMSEEANRDYIEKNINLAKNLTDGEKIYFPKTSDNTNSIKGQTNSNKVNINTASSSELDTLSGVGSVTASKIIEGRPYSAIDDLLAKKIVTKSVFEKIKESISVY